VTVKNDGTANLVINSLSFNGTHPGSFQKLSGSDTCSGKTLAPTQSCSVSVVFKPAATGPRSATLTVSSNDPDENPVNVALSGVGL
jgi:hypothetical protein